MLVERRPIDYMSNNYAPTIFPLKYLLNHQVFIIKEYSLYGLSRIRYRDEDEEFTVDSGLLTEVPSREHTINIRLLGGSFHDT